MYRYSIYYISTCVGMINERFPKPTVNIRVLQDTILCFTRCVLPCLSSMWCLVCRRWRLRCAKGKGDLFVKKKAHYSWRIFPHGTSVEQSFQNYEPISVNWTLLKYYDWLIQIGPRELAKIHLNSLEALRPLVEAPFFVACIACAISIPSTPMPPMASFCSTANFFSVAYNIFGSPRFIRDPCSSRTS